MDPIRELSCSSWNDPMTSELLSTTTSVLEEGLLLFLPRLVFDLSAEERRFLSPRYLATGAKNISFNANNHSIKGLNAHESEQAEVKALLARFASQAQTLIAQLFPNYVAHLKIGRTSLRTTEVSGRQTSWRKDDRRLHVDAFPANPNQGQRILRVFSNVNPEGKPRVWRIGEPFESMAKRFLPTLKRPMPGYCRALHWLKITKSYRTEYDHIMLQLHDGMKKNLDYQRQAPQTQVSFPSNSSWVVQTDQVSHAAVQGQHLLEQTFYLPHTAMQSPDLSPLKVLERLTGRALV